MDYSKKIILNSILFSFVFIGIIFSNCAKTTGVQELSPKRTIESASQLASEILDKTGVKGGLIVHVGCGEGKLTAALYANKGYLVQGLSRNRTTVEKARNYIKSKGPYGEVSATEWSGKSLPYIDNFVNLLVWEESNKIPTEELMRVLAPGGIAYIRKGEKWEKLKKPTPEGIDQWTHYMYDASNNPVSHDRIVGPPRHLQWVGSPKWGRHHEHMASMSALVTSKGRIFYIMDEGLRYSPILPSHWSLIARDAFNGTILWKRKIPKWLTQLWPLKSGPAYIPRRLVAMGDTVFVTLGLEAPVEAIDASTGKTIQTYKGTRDTEEIIVSDGILFLLSNKPPTTEKEYSPKHEICWDNMKEANRGCWAWRGEEEQRIMAVKSRTGRILWEKKYPVAPMSMAVDKDGVFFYNGQKVVSLDRRNGEIRWESQSFESQQPIRSCYAPTLIVYKDVVMFSGGKGSMVALSKKNGEKLWESEQPSSGHQSPEDLLIIDDLVWTGATAGGAQSGRFTGRNLYTGKIEKDFLPDKDAYWFHQRCYQSKATEKYILTPRNGTEFVDVKSEEWHINHWVRGGCVIGVIPANGLIYTPPNPCACYMKSKLTGFNALTPAKKDLKNQKREVILPRLEKGPAYNKINSGRYKGKDLDSWPTYRHDPGRSGSIRISVSSDLTLLWQSKIGGKKLSSVVISGGKIYVAEVDAHTVYALDAGSGEIIWSYTAGGRVDSPPTIYKGRVLFGSADGWVYCLRSRDGKLVWRFRAAPKDKRLTSFEQIESVWPVHGSVLIQDDALYCVAGRSRFLDGGMRLLKLDPTTGHKISETVLDSTQVIDNKEIKIQERIRGLDMPVALPDILSSDGKYIYLRNQPFDLKGLPHHVSADTDYVNQGGQTAHLFSAAGFLDNTWFHRTYWQYGKSYVSGCNWWARNGKYSPSGRLLVFDDSRVIGFGRKVEYWRWSTPLEFHLYSALKPSSWNASKEKSVINVEGSNNLNPAGKSFSVEAWIKAEDEDGVVIAKGGKSYGYAISLKGGYPQFMVRYDNNFGRLATVSAKEKVSDRWVHLAGILTEDCKLKLYVDGELSVSEDCSGYIEGEPKQALTIGADGGSPVERYAISPNGFKGIIDEVKVYQGELTTDEIKAHFRDPKSIKANKAKLVLYYNFDNGKAWDYSGYKNHGSVVGARAVESKFGKGMRFSGWKMIKSDFNVKYQWSEDMPMHVRAMVKANEKIFLVGTPDVLDEEKAFYNPHDPEIKATVKEQEKSFKGMNGSSLWVVSVKSGEKLSEYKLNSTSVFDGMAAAEGRLFISMKDGSIRCYGNP